MNIVVGNYETKNFDIYEPAAAAFGEFSTDDKEVAAVVEHAAKFVDSALGILKKSIASGYLNTSDLDELIDDIDRAEEELDSVDELDNHYYLRDNLEPMAIEMYDLSDVNADDNVEDYANEEEWLFGRDDEDENGDTVSSSSEF